MARHLLPVVVGALAMAVGVSACGGDGGEPRPDLLLVSSRDGPYAIFALDADGGNQQRLTPGELVLGTETLEDVFFEIEPDWSPDGRRVAFASTREGAFDVFTVGADGTGITRLTSTRTAERHPTWSPDGGRIAYERDASDIYVMNADGSGARVLTDAAASESQPAWSPDGELIAYVRREAGSEVREIWLMRPDGSEPRRITTLKATSIHPAWSPDGTMIAFASNAVGPLFDIYLVTVGVKGVKRLTRSGGDAFEPAWSPDGSSIAFAQDGAIATVDLDGNVDRITDEDDNDSAPAWNPVAPSADESG